MAGEADQIREGLKGLGFGTGRKVESFEATVKAVDWSKRTCTVATEDGREIPGVRLRAVIDNDTVGFAIKPKINSQVIVTVLNGNEVSLFVSLYTDWEQAELELDNVNVVIEATGKVKLKAKNLEIEADQTAFNGGNNKGLVKLVESVAKFNAIERDLNTLKGVFSGWTPVPQDGGLALKLAAATWYGQQIAETIEADLENTKVTH